MTTEQNTQTDTDLADLPLSQRLQRLEDALSALQQRELADYYFQTAERILIRAIFENCSSLDRDNALKDFRQMIALTAEQQQDSALQQAAADVEALLFPTRS
ncbi:hypothetical protein E4T80_12135 [Muribacter muris]|uniref:Uncharacterized protein n=1 Tax=Muribacter muris TaxID=67855 RepID=A0A4Y9JP65_9PAST|nr:hypothetical protein [Muribacter muris]MBF0786212.1 hypothetical protein [Muribacter muris]MBF0826455.1 hypothetical protein [Muribacter muris]TFV07574.1 hypothetical protein E4T80_12135 [Muribacter muris]